MSDGTISLAEAKKRLRKGGGRRGAEDPPEEPPPPPEDPPPDLEACPVTPLGKRDGHFYFFDADGELRALTSQQLGQNPQILALFGGSVSWLMAHFPQRDRDTNRVVWFTGRRANQWLVAACRDAGLFRPDEPRRGLGLWRAEEELLLHLGAEVRLLRAGQVRRAGFRGFGALWPALPRTPEPAEEAASGMEALRLEEAFELWNWEQAGSHSLFFGLWAAGLLGAGIRWRPHGLVVGPAGSGKTTLMELYAAVSPLAAFWNDYTEAGLRQSLSGRAAPLILDEAEGDAEGAHKLMAVIKLLRLASQGDGAQSVRGSSGGISQTFTVTCSAILGGILPPDLLPQDASRITRLDLLPRAPDGPGLPSAAERAELRALAPRLWARAIAALPRFAANLERLHAALMARGCSTRLSDQLGTILAARAAMLWDEAISAEQAAAEVEAFAWWAVTEEEQATDGGPHSCFRHLLASPADVVRHGERPTLRTLLLEALRGAEGDEARRILLSHGLKLAPYPQRSAGPVCLYVADKNPRLAGVFGGTPWAGSRWKEDLKRLRGAFRPGPQWILSKERCTVLPADLLPRDELPPATLAELEAIAGEHGLGAAWILEQLRGGVPREAALATAGGTARAPPAPA